MSHIATVQSAITDLTCLQTAMDVLGVGRLHAHLAVRAYASALRADYGVTLPGPYDLGFAIQPDGTYALVGDSELHLEYDNGRNREARALMGPALHRLHEEYNIATVLKQIEGQQVSVERLSTPAGVELVLTAY